MDQILISSYQQRRNSIFQKDKKLEFKLTKLVRKIFNILFVTYGINYNICKTPLTASWMFW